MNTPSSQSASQEVYNESNQNLLQQQGFQNQINALAQAQQTHINSYPQGYDNQYIPRMAGSKQNTPAGHLATPAYSPNQDPFFIMEGVGQGQLKAIQENITRQQQIKSLQNRGYGAVLAGVELYKGASGKHQGGFGDMVSNITTFGTGNRTEKYQAKLGAARSRTDPKYHHILTPTGHFAGSIRTSAIQLARQGLLDYIAGKIINSSQLDPFMDASVVEQTALAQAQHILSIYTNQLDGKEIKNSSDVIQMMNMIDGMMDGDNTDLMKFQASMDTLSAEGVAVNDFIEAYRLTAGQERAQALETLADDERSFDVNMSQVQMEPVRKAALNTFLDSINPLKVAKGMTKGAASEVNNFLVNTVGVGVASLMDIGNRAGELITGQELPTPADFNVQRTKRLGYTFDKLLSSEDPSLPESAGRLLVKVGLGMGLAYLFFPAASIPTAAIIGVAGTKIVNALAAAGKVAAHSFLDVFFEDEESRSRVVLGNLLESGVDAAILYLTHRASGAIRRKSMPLSNILETSDLLAQADETTRKIVMSEAEKISISDAYDLVENSIALGEIEAQTIPFERLQAARNLMNANDYLLESGSLNIAARDYIQKTILNQLNNIGRDRNILLDKGTATEMIAVIEDVKRLAQADYDMSLIDPDTQISSARVLPTEDILDITSNRVGSNAVVAGYIDGLNFIIAHEKIGTTPTRVKQLKRLQDALRSGNGEKIIEARDMVGTFSKQETQAIKVRVNDMYPSSGDEPFAGQEIIKTKNRLQDLLLENMTEEQQQKYKQANLTMETLYNINPVIEYLGGDDFNTYNVGARLGNRAGEIGSYLDGLIADAIVRKAPENVVTGLRKIQDTVLLGTAVEAVRRDVSLTPTEVNNIKSSVQNASGEPTLKSAIISALNVMEHLTKSITSDMNRSSTGVHVSMAALDFALNFLKGLDARAYRIPSTIIGFMKKIASAASIKPKNIRALSVMTDMLYENPEIAKGILDILKDPTLNKKSLITNGFTLLPLKHFYGIEGEDEE